MFPRYALVSLKNRVLEPTTPKPKNATKEVSVGGRIRLVTTKISDVNQDRFPSQAMTIWGTASNLPRRNLVTLSAMSEVTHILSAIEQGDPQSTEQLLLLVYRELRKLAAQKLAREKPGQTLQATALVHEAYLRLLGGQRTDPSRPNWDSRGHFFAAAAEAMRRILVEQARRKARTRHGGQLLRVDLVDDEVTAPQSDEQILLLDDALTRLSTVRPQAAELVKMRFFSGLTIEEIARMLDLSPRTARRLWVFARAWLRRDMAAHASS
jgi:RNA polymerase sigma factor (TIGR02999 family)